MGHEQKEKIKFPMHDLHFKKSLLGVYKACAASLITGALFYFLHNATRKQNYRTFYSTYDPCKSFERMKDGGYLDSCLSDEQKQDKEKEKKEREEEKNE